MAAKKEYFYYIDTASSGEKLAFVEKGSVTRNGYTSNYKTIKIAGTNNVKVRGIFFDTDLTMNTMSGTFSNIPARFHEYIVNKVIASGYKEPRHMELNVAQYFDDVYDKGIKKAKQFARANYIKTGHIASQDF